jgi:hypothetical protein
MSRIRLLVLLSIAVSASLVTTASAAPAPGLGSDTGGSPQTSACPAGSVLVGVTAAATPLFAMRIVGRMHAICAASAQARGTVVDDHVANLGSRLSPPRTHATRLVCPAGRVVTALTGRSGDLVDRVGVRCQALDADGRPAGAATVSGEAGGHGGIRRRVRACPAGTVGVGLVGDVRVGEANVLDFVALDCAAAPAAPAALPAAA